MSNKPPSRAACQLQAVSKALVRERQLENWRKEIADGIATLLSQQKHAEREALEIQGILDADPELTAVARQLMKEAGDLKGSGDEEFSVYNPNYVTSDDKRKLLAKILRDFHRENPNADAMSFAAIKAVLKSRYGIETASAGLFFRSEIKGWETRGGNKNKSVLLAQERLV
jgi:hypothetical protein